MFGVRSLSGLLAFLLVVSVLAVGLNAAPPAGIAWQKDVQTAVRESARQRKPMLVLVDARWCGACQRMLNQTFPTPAVAARISSQFIPVRVDADEQPQLVQSLKVDAMPTLLVISPERRIIARMTGFQSAAQLDGRLAAFKPAKPVAPPRTVAPPKPQLDIRPVTDDRPVPRPPEEKSSQTPSTLDAALDFSGGAK